MCVLNLEGVTGFCQLGAADLMYVADDSSIPLPTSMPVRRRLEPCMPIVVDTEPALWVWPHTTDSPQRFARPNAVRPET